jgi:hypothetical protein
LIRFRLGVVGEHKLAAVSCRNMNIDARSEAGCESVQAGTYNSLRTGMMSALREMCRKLGKS